MTAISFSLPVVEFMEQPFLLVGFCLRVAGAAMSAPLSVQPSTAVADACRSTELNELPGGNTAAELLRTAAFSDTAQVDGGEAEALDEINDREPCRCVVG